MEILSHVFTPSLLYAAFRSATPVIYAALCAAMTMQAGILNIGTEGIMLMGAFLAVAFSNLTGSWFIGVIAAMLGGSVIALILAVGSLRYNASMPAICTGMNMFVLAFTRFLMTPVFGVSGTFTSPDLSSIPRIHIAFLEKFPVLNAIFNDWCLTEVFVIIMIALLSFVFYKTRWGLRMRSVGKFELAAQTAGINTLKVKYQSLLLSGLLGGLAGAHLSLGYSNMFVQNMTNNRGFMGIAAMWFGGGDPLMTSVGCLIFGFFDSIGARLQPYGLPSQIVLAMPYIIVVIVLSIMLAIKKRNETRKKSSLYGLNTAA